MLTAWEVVIALPVWLITGRHIILFYPLAYYRETPRWAMHVRTIEIKLQGSAQGDNLFNNNNNFSRVLAELSA